MKVFNQGQRRFALKELSLQPGQFTEIPLHHTAAVKKLLEDYPTELVSAETADSNAAKQAQTIAELRGLVDKLTTENKELKANTTLAELREIHDAVCASLDEQKARSVQLETDLRTARDRVTELMAENTRLLESLTAPKTVAPDA